MKDILSKLTISIIFLSYDCRIYYLNSVLFIMHMKFYEHLNLNLVSQLWFR